MLVLHTHKKRDLVHVGLQRNGCETVIRGSRMACQVTSGRIIHILRVEQPFILLSTAIVQNSLRVAAKVQNPLIT